MSARLAHCRCDGLTVRSAMNLTRVLPVSAAREIAACPRVSSARCLPGWPNTSPTSSSSARPTTSACCRRSSRGPNGSTACSSSMSRTSAERDQIWQMHRAEFGIPGEPVPAPTTPASTGAEIRSCCRLAALLDITLFQAAQHVVPVAVTAAESMENLRPGPAAVVSMRPSLASTVSDAGQTRSPGAAGQRQPKLT